jgi:hypothetical protein
MQGEELKGPEKYISLPIRVLGMDAYSAIGLVPIVIFPFVIWSWLIAFIVLVLVFVASRFRLPSYQLIRYIRVRSGPTTLTPTREQQYREKRSTRIWPY